MISSGRYSEHKISTESLRPKTPITGSVIISFYAEGKLFLFRFEQHEGRVLEGESVKIDNSSYHFEMNALCL